MYSAKGGVIPFTKAIAREMAHYKVNANCVCLGGSGARGAVGRKRV